jgi:hypothetical protein
MADKDFVVKNGLVVNTAFLANSTGLYFSNTLTVNTTLFVGTANNTSFVGSVSAANVVSNSQLSSNLANYTNTAGLINVTANNTSFVGSVSAANVVSNSQLSANLSNYLTLSGVSSNVVKVTSNSANFLGSVPAANYITNYVDGWKTSSDSVNRFYFATTGRTYFGNGGNGFEWRNASGTTLSVLSETGAFSAITTITSYSSDRRLKENFRPLEDALNKVSKLNGCTFDWKQEECNQYDFWPETIKNEVGLIAQEVEDVLPQAVCEAPFDTKDENGVKVSRSGKNFKTIQYEKLIPLLVEAIKELRNQVEELRNK